MKVRRCIDYKEYKRLKGEGYTDKSIARIMGMSVTTLSKKLKEVNKIPPRKSW